ncbi:hypothetical protein F5Y08DRAFT_319852 [Xylaria arbuscula]|nr:hypothetical protein F5Y08DRAFT_319852 [Xylaria arbuscula]
MANLGPLTTVYVASGTGCHSTHVAIAESERTLIQQGTISDCFPSGFNPDPKSYYYSPGICPQGFTYACSGNVGLPDVTAATCCPTGFTCRWGVSISDQNPCFSLFKSDDFLSVDVLSYKHAIPTSVGTTTMPCWAGGTVFANGLVVRRGAGDREWPIIPTETTVTVTSGDPQTSHNPPYQPGQGSSNLSAGATAGIVVALIAVLLLMAGLAVAAYRCGKKRTVKPVKEQDPFDRDAEDIWGEAKLSAHEVEEQRSAQELTSSRDPAELMA